MTQTEYGAHQLSRAECLALLPMAPFGRLVFTEGALPAIIPVNFVLDPDGIILRTREGGSVAAAGGAVVAFQADDIDAERRSGWSVTVIGRATVVRQPMEVERLSTLPLLPWVGGERHTFVAVSIDIVAGLRLGGPEPAHTAAPAFSRGAAVRAS